MIVVDSAALVDLIIDAGPRGVKVRERVAGTELTAPDFIKVEAMSALRGLVLGGVLNAAAADAAFEALCAVPVELHPSLELLRPAWALRFNVSAYDACYIALAAALNAPLITNDTKLSRIKNLPCEIETFLRVTD